jgi:hypothetical protein
MEDQLGTSVWAALIRAGEVWLVVSYVVCMFVVVTFRPNQIHNLARFRFSYNLFALYFLVPAVTEAILAIAAIEGVVSPRGQGTGIGLVLVTVLLNIVNKVLLAGFITCGLGCLLPTHENPASPPGGWSQ